MSGQSVGPHQVAPQQRRPRSGKETAAATEDQVQQSTGATLRRCLLVTKVHDLPVFVSGRMFLESADLSQHLSLTVTTHCTVLVTGNCR